MHHYQNGVVGKRNREWCHVVIAALCFSQYSITVNVSHLCKKRLTWDFSGQVVLLLLALLVAVGVPVDWRLMGVLVAIEFAVYFEFIWRILTTISRALRVGVFAVKFASDSCVYYILLTEVLHSETNTPEGVILFLREQSGDKRHFFG